MKPQIGNHVETLTKGFSGRLNTEMAGLSGDSEAVSMIFRLLIICEQVVETAPLWGGHANFGPAT